jgi:hypothetical protein
MQDDLQHKVGGMMRIGKDTRYSMLNSHQQEIRAMLLNPDTEFYAKTDDPVYEEFRKNIRDREAFNNKIQSIKLNDRIKIWRTQRNIEEDCKAILQRQEERKRQKQERIKKYLLCGCLRKKRISAARKQWMKLANRSRAILRKKKDNHYQGFQGEPCEYTLHKHNVTGAFLELLLFMALAVIGSAYIMDMYVPGIFAKSYQELIGIANIPGLLGQWIYNGSLRILQVPVQQNQ